MLPHIFYHIVALPQEKGLPQIEHCIFIEMEEYENLFSEYRDLIKNKVLYRINLVKFFENNEK
jgi:hypothetical protein